MFSELSLVDREHFATAFTTHVYKPESVIIAEGEEGHMFYIIKSGFVS